MVINAIEMKLKMVKTVAQCVKIKINRKHFQTNLCMNYWPQIKAISTIEIMSRLGEHHVLSFRRNISGQNLIKHQ